ncbi:MAG: efflux RND transporter permease subunit [Sedimentisphaeraceae bacterium JB056]
MSILKKRRYRGPIGWMAGHTVASNLIMLFCIIGGFMMLSHIKQEVFPDLTLDMVTVTVPYPGASPEEVERGIVLSIEESVRGLDGVKEVSSTANEGVGTVTIELLEGENLQKLSQDIQNEVDQITTFPEDAEEPQITVVSRQRGAISLAIYGDVNPSVLHELGEQIRDELLQLPTVTQLELTGVRPLEISIEVPQENLRRYNLTLSQISQIIGSSAIEIPGGGVKTAGGEILVRMKERRDYGRQFATLPIITTDDGTQVLLEDIAQIKDGFEDTDYYATYNDLPAVMIEVYRVGEQTPIEVADSVMEYIENNKEALPPGIKLSILEDRSDIFRQRINLLVKNGAMGLVLVLIVLGLFLELRLAFWVMLGIPISFLGSFLILPLFGVSINMVSMFAYIIALGIVVDDAIVVGENIYYLHQKGMPFLEAAVKGAKEVAMPVTFSILTNIAAFMPLYFIPGIMGKIFLMIPTVVTIVFLISLAESLFILPSHLGHQKDRKRKGLSRWFHQRQQGFSRRFTHWVNDIYQPFLDKSLRNRYIVLSTGAAILIIAICYAASGRMGFALFPTVESDFSVATITLPYGAPVEKTEAIAKRLYKAAREVVDESGKQELVEGIFSEVGAGGSHVTKIRVYLADADVREKIMSTETFTKRWREKTGPIVGADKVLFEADAGGPGSGASLTVELSHRDIDVLDKASAELAAELENYPRVADIDSGYQKGKQQIDFTVTPQGKSLGLTASSIARQVRNAFYGAEAIRQQRGRNEIKIMVRLPEQQRISEYDIENLILRNSEGKEIMLREAAKAQKGRAYTNISRREGRRVVTVSANVTPRDKSGEVLANLKKDALPKLMKKYRGLTYSFEGRQADQRESLGSLKSGFSIAMLVVFALLAIPFRSYLQPLIVMVSIPFGIVGAIIGHIIMGYSLSIVSMLGIVALAGVVVNDSLVLIEFANRRRQENKDTAHDAVLASATQRFRPILLTTLTTFGGLMPMIFETERSARFLIPMAISLGFGVVFATSITLLLVPSLYMVVEDIKDKAEKTKEKAAELSPLTN